MRRRRMSKKTDSDSKALPPAVYYLNAGLSGIITTCIVHPLDVLKNRMQMSNVKVSTARTALSILRNESISKFYAGLSAGIVRQATYTSVKIGIFNHLVDIHKEMHHDERLSFQKTGIYAAVAGATAAFIGTPAELVLVRMTSDGRLAPELRRNYKNVVHAFVRIWKDEGFTNLWRGSKATMGRAAIVNVSQLVTFVVAEHFIAREFSVPEGTQLHVYSLMLSGLVSSFNSMPLDIAKTRIQNLQNLKDIGKVKAEWLYVMSDIVKLEGLRALWKGYWPTYFRMTCHTIFTYSINDVLNQIYRLHYEV